MRPATGWIANRTFTPFARNKDVISDIVYCAFATAIPYPTTCNDRNVRLGNIIDAQEPYKNDVVSIYQCLCNVVCVCLCYLTLNFVVLGRQRRSSTTKKHIRERTI